MALTAVVALTVSYRVLEDASAQEESAAAATPIATAEAELSATAAVEVDDATPETALPAATPALSCVDRFLSLDKVRNSTALRQNADLAGAVFTRLDDGSIKVEVVKVTALGPYANSSTTTSSSVSYP